MHDRYPSRQMQEATFEELAKLSGYSPESYGLDVDNPIEAEHTNPLHACARIVRRYLTDRGVRYRDDLGAESLRQLKIEIDKFSAKLPAPGSLLVLEAQNHARRAQLDASRRKVTKAYPGRFTGVFGGVDFAQLYFEDQELPYLGLVVISTVSQPAGTIALLTPIDGDPPAQIYFYASN